MAGEQAVSEDVLEILRGWLDRRQDALASLGVAVSTTWGPSDRDPASAWVDFATSDKSARLIVWSNGLADLTVGDFVKGEVLLEEHREILSDVGFDDAEATVRAWLVDG
jgi:hypothetical protein